jgi:Flp pilus assembly protein TadD
MTLRIAFLVVALAALLGATGAARAADTPDSSPAAAPVDKLAAARAHIAARRWPAAIDELKRVDDRRSADWNNLMGYSLRKNAPPDLAGAEKFYTEALRMAPEHRGALEYSGELYLMAGDLARAEQRLATLGKSCAMQCEEYADLKKAVAAFKAGGGKAAAGP